MSYPAVAMQSALVAAMAAPLAWGCLRTAVPMIMGPDDYRPLGRLDEFLPLKGRWSRGVVGGRILFVGVAATLITGFALAFLVAALFLWQSA